MGDLGQFVSIWGDGNVLLTIKYESLVLKGQRSPLLSSTLLSSPLNKSLSSDHMGPQQDFWSQLWPRRDRALTGF